MASIVITLVCMAIIAGIMGSLLTSGGAHADVEIDGGTVRVIPVGLAKFWSFTSKRTIPLRAITNVTTADDVRALNVGWRVGGSAFPGVILAGKFWSKAQGRAWLCVGKGRPVVVITADGERYRRTIFSTTDPRATVAKLTTVAPAA